MWFRVGAMAQQLRKLIALGLIPSACTWPLTTVYTLGIQRPLIECVFPGRSALSLMLRFRLDLYVSVCRGWNRQLSEVTLSFWIISIMKCTWGSLVSHALSFSCILCLGLSTQFWDKYHDSFCFPISSQMTVTLSSLSIYFLWFSQPTCKVAFCFHFSEAGTEVYSVR